MRTTVSITSQRITKQSQTRDQVFDLIESVGVGHAIPSGAAAEPRLRRLAPDRPRRDRRAGARGLSRPQARERHLRQRAEDRAGADDVLLQRGDAQARDAPGQQDARRSRSSTRAPTSGAACTSRRPSGSSSPRACGSPTTRRWRSRRCTSREPLVPGLTRQDFDETSFYDLLTNRYGIEIVGGVQTIEPTVTNEEESEILGVPLHSPAFQFERTTRSEIGDDRRVRPLDLPRRPLPARHRAEPARPLGRRAGLPARGSRRP